MLAYRYALARLHRQWEPFEQALAGSRALGLDQRHHDDTVLILWLTPDDSRRRRAAAAGNPRYRLWFDLEFLGYYAEFIRDLTHWITPGPRWRHHHADAPTVRAVLPADTPQPQTGRRLAGGDVVCGRDCGTPRSATVRTGAAAIQLWSSSLHYHRPGKPMRCLRNADEITAAIGDSPDAT